MIIRDINAIHPVITAIVKMNRTVKTMANIKRIDGKTGVSFKITVTTGRNTDGKQVRHFKTWKPEPGMTPKQIEKAADFMADFIRKQA